MQQKTLGEEDDAMISGASQSNPYMIRSVATPASNPLGVEWVGGASTPAAPAATSAPAAVSAPAQPMAQQPVAQSQVQPMAQVLSQIFSGLMNALKGIVGWIANLFKQQPATQPPAGQTQPPVAQPPVTQPPVSQPPVVQPPVSQPPATGVDYTAIARQYNLLATPENVQAFLNEVKTYETDGALGPGSANAQAVKDLQTVLAKFGYAVPATGVYDNVTAQAIIQFKTQNGIRQSYKAANGQPAVNEYADKQTLEFIMKKLEAAMAQPPVQQPAQPPVAQPPVQQPPVAQPPVAQPPVAQPPVQQPPVVQQPTQPATGGVNVAAIAQQYNLLATAENVQAFLNEVKTYETDGALGPGTANTSAVKDLQTVLAKFGFAVPATGTYDNATAQAVIQFKTQNGIRQSYKAANGQPAVNEYADKQTLEFIMKKLEAAMAQPAQPQAPVQSVPAPAATPATASNPLGMQWQGGAPAQAPVYQAPVQQAPAAAPAAQPQAPNPLGLEWVS
jgi:peptidoglycan hydrolase-like protein with peptidoglycan-binding domain